VPQEEELLPIGQAQLVQQGTDLTVVSWGAMMHTTEKAVEQLQQARGVSIELIDLLTISPMDSATIITSIKKTGRCVVVQEAPRSFGPASEIIARINDEALLYLEAPVKRLTQFDVVTPYFAREELYVHSPARVSRAMEQTLDF